MFGCALNHCTDSSQVNRLAFIFWKFPNYTSRITSSNRIRRNIFRHHGTSPDNGSLTHLKSWVGITDIREIDQTVNRLQGKNTERVGVFHGRDVFAYCAARLASGLISFEEVGPAYPVEEIVLHPIHEPEIKPGQASGIFEINDPNFGNLWTNFPVEDFTAAGFAYGDRPLLIVRHAGETVFSQRLLFHQSFGFVEKGEPIIYNNELNRVSVAINQGKFNESYNIGYGPDWVVVISK